MSNNDQNKKSDAQKRKEAEQKKIKAEQLKKRQSELEKKRQEEKLKTDRNPQKKDGSKELDRSKDTVKPGNLEKRNQTSRITELESKKTQPNEQSSRRKKETQEQRDARIKAEIDAEYPFDLAGPPPDPSKNIKKSIPVGEIKIENLHKPKDRAKEKSESTPSDRQKISPERKKIRETVAHPADGIGCAFDKSPAKKDIDDYMASRGKTDAWRLAYSNSEIVVTAFCSSEGSKEANQKLGHKRANDTIDHLVNKYGIKRERFTVEVVGDDISDKMAPGTDRPEDRVVMIDITAHEKKRVEGPKHMDVHAVHGVGDLPDTHPDKTRLQIGDHPKDRSFPVGKERLGIHNNETGKLVLIRTKDIPEGHSKINNTWVYRKGQQLESRAMLPTTPDTVKDQLLQQKRAKTNKSLTQKIEISAGEMLRRISLNMSLNREINSFIAKGHSLGSALKKSRQAGVDRVRQSIADVTTGAYMDKFILGELSKHNL